MSDHKQDEDDRTADDDQDDSIETFRAAWLNQWPSQPADSTPGSLTLPNS